MNLKSAQNRGLRFHNSIFQKQAVSLTVVDVSLCRFFVTYADGQIKWDYQCGSGSRKIKTAIDPNY